MKLHQDQSQTLNTVTAYDTGYVEVNAQRHQGAVYFMPQGPVHPWGATTLAGLATEEIARLLTSDPEIILLGTGGQQRFPAPELIAPLVVAGCGYEVMSTPAACRTYNILMSEGRLVMAALLPI